MLSNIFFLYCLSWRTQISVLITEIIIILCNIPLNRVFFLMKIIKQSPNKITRAKFMKINKNKKCQD